MTWLAVLVAVGWLGIAAPVAAQNAQHGDSGSRSRQDGGSRSGDAVGGPGLAVIREGDVRVEMRNAPDAVEQRVSVVPGAVEVASPSRPAQVSSGDAVGSNEVRVFVGQSTAGSSDVLLDVFAFAIGQGSRG